MTAPARALAARFAGVVLGSLALPLLLAAGTAAAAPASPSTASSSASAATPQLSIAIDNGKKSVAKGDRARYTITAHNIGTTGVDNLQITQTIPSGMRLVSADQHGKRSAGLVSWQVNLAAGASRSFHTIALVQATPSQLLRLATVACAVAHKQPRPLVCAAHSDQLPAGAAAAAAATGAKRAGPGGHHWASTAVGAGVAVVLVALAGLLVKRRRVSYRV